MGQEELYELMKWTSNIVKFCAFNRKWFDCQDLSDPTRSASDASERKAALSHSMIKLSDICLHKSSLFFDFLPHILMYLSLACQSDLLFPASGRQESWLLRRKLSLSLRRWVNKWRRGVTRKHRDLIIADGHLGDNRLCHYSITDDAQMLYYTSSFYFGTRRSRMPFVSKQNLSIPLTYATKVTDLISSPFSVVYVIYIYIYMKMLFFCVLCELGIHFRMHNDSYR